MPLKSAPQLLQAPCIEAASFRAVERVLVNDQFLGPKITKLCAWRDEDDDLLEPTWSTCPFIKITPAPSESDWITEGQHNMPMVIRLILATQGTGIENIMGLWSLVRGAIFPQDVTAAALIAQKIQDALPGYIGGVTKPTIQINGYGSMVDDQGLRMMVAEGVIRFGMLVAT